MLETVVCGEVAAGLGCSHCHWNAGCRNDRSAAFDATRRAARPLAAFSWGPLGTRKKPKQNLFRLFFERLAATYSRGVYKTTTIGKTVFDGRVRNGNGSDHSFMATKSAGARPPRLGRKSGSNQDRRRKYFKERAGTAGGFSENCI